MAKQNFLKGSYTGKLGVTVGQKWKNIKALRTYVVPHDAKSDAQLTQRSAFKGAVHLAQLAQACNNSTTAFNSTTNTKWALRVSAARNLAKAAKTELDTVPLFPADFDPPFMVTKATYGTLSSGGALGLTIEGTLPTVNRSCVVIVHKKDTEFDPDEVLLFPATFNPTLDEQLTISAPYGNQVETGDIIRVVSTDDTASSTDMLSSWKQEIESGGPPIVPFNTTITNITIATDKVTIRTSQAWETPTSSKVSGTLTYISKGVEETATVTDATLVNDSGFFGVEFAITWADEWEKPAFPNTCKFSFTEIKATTATATYQKLNGQETVTNTDLTRNVTIQWTCVEKSDKQFYFTTPMRFATATTKAVTAVYDYFDTFFDEDDNPTNINAEIKIDSTQGYFTHTEAVSNQKVACGNKKVTQPAFAETFNGVTYNFAQQQIPYTNTKTTFSVSYVGSSFCYKRTDSGSNYIIQLGYFCEFTRSFAFTIACASMTASKSYKVVLSGSSNRTVVLTGGGTWDFAANKEWGVPLSASGTSYASSMGTPEYVMCLGSLPWSTVSVNATVTVNGKNFTQPIKIDSYEDELDIYRVYPS